MFDIWAFLLQTLNASGVAMLILVIKWMFRDKLPPKWQFGIWSVLGIALVIPAGMGGRYVLLNWPMVVDLLKTMTGDYSFTRVVLPLPVLTAAPKSVWDWLFILYILGALYNLVKYAVSYIRLRMILSHGSEVTDDRMKTILNLAADLKVPLCRCVEVRELPSAFVCGLFSPILALPADEEVDEKVLLHELMHLKSRDTFWSIPVCLFKSLHWCNPLLVHCADQVLHDLEARCDQMVLEMLEGEERRDYGRILLSMSNDRYARTPGATCINNGGGAIRQRIEAIARFKLYPAGMKLVSVCAIVMLLPVVFGIQADSLYETGSITSLDLSSARTVYCTTPAGAFDCYAKSILTGKDTLRVMCAPEDMQAELVESFGSWEPVLPVDPVIQSGYYIYNLVQKGDAYEGLLVLALSSPEVEEKLLLGIQPVRAEHERDRWVVTALDDFSTVESTYLEAINWGCSDLPGVRYNGTYEDFRVEIAVQTVYEVDNWVRTSGFFGGSSAFDLTPKPNAEFSEVAVSCNRTITHLGTQDHRDQLTHIGLGYAPVREDEEPPDRAYVGSHMNSSGSSTDGSSFVNESLEPGWGPVLDLLGGGSKYPVEKYPQELPLYYLAELYLNGQYTATLDLLPQKGGPQ